jgi:acetyl esterase/lipase
MKFLSLLLALAATGLAQDAAKTETNLSYYDAATLETADDYQKQQCQLDVFHPTGATGFPTVIWFHGGGFTEGHRDFPNLKGQGIAIVSVGYRLSPAGKFPCFLDDAAAATAWTFRHIADYGGDPKKIFISGHSAGAYLALMVGMDPRRLMKYGISNRDIAGLIPVSSQVTTHFKVKELRGDTGEALRPIIDEYAPLYYSSKNLPPICLITGDRKIEFKSRVEENDLFAVTLKNLGHPDVEFHELAGFDHGHAAEGAAPLIGPYIRRVLSKP